MSRVQAIVTAFAEEGINVDRVSQSTLIFRQPIVAGNSTYTFATLQNQAPVLPGEIRLDLQDLFAVTTIAVCFSGTYNIAGPPAVSVRDYFFASMFQMDLAALPLMTLYQGTMAVDINNIRYLDRWDLQRHKYAGQTQLQGFVGGVTEFFQQNEISGNTSGFFPVDPAIILNGDAKNTFTIQMPTNTLTPVLNLPFADPAGVAATVDIDQIVIIARGYLAQNSSKSN